MSCSFSRCVCLVTWFDEPRLRYPIHISKRSVLLIIARASLIIPIIKFERLRYANEAPRSFMNVGLSSVWFRSKWIRWINYRDKFEDLLFFYGFTFKEDAIEIENALEGIRIRFVLWILHVIIGWLKNKYFRYKYVRNTYEMHTIET